MEWSYVSFYSNQLQLVAGGSFCHEFLACSRPDSSKDFTTYLLLQMDLWAAQSGLQNILAFSLSLQALF